MSTTFRLGAFILFTSLVFAGAVFWIGSKQFVFAKTYRVYAEFQNAAGLSAGSEVRVGGVPEGTVKRIDLPKRADGKVRVTMDLKQETHEVIKTDSIASIRSEGLVGDKYVEVSFGTVDTQKVRDGDVIQSEVPVQISDLIKKADGILDSAKTSMVTVEEVTSNVAAITGKINRGHGTAGALINDKRVYQQASDAVTALKEDAEAMKHNFLLRGFFKNRGYEDSGDIAKHKIPEVPEQAPGKSFVLDAKKIFDKPDTAKLKKNKQLEQVGAYLEQNPFGLVVVSCRADLKGDTEKMKALTEARAMTVRAYLVQNFEMDDNKVFTIGHGKTKEAGDGGDVTVLVYPAGTKQAAPAPAATRPPAAPTEPKS